jgi:hypothetical protein
MAEFRQEKIRVVTSSVDQDDPLVPLTVDSNYTILWTNTQSFGNREPG